MDSSPVMYFIVNTDLKMSAGKVASQVAHASIDCYLKSRGNRYYNVWKKDCYPKIILGASQKVMLDLQQKYKNNTEIIYDSGLTEIRVNSPTVLGFHVAPKILYPELKDLFLYK